MFKSQFVKLRNNESRILMRLAWPLILTQVGHVVTGMVDTIFLGQIGPTEQAAGILANNLYILLLVFCIGVSYATTPLVTAAHEEGNSFKKASLFKNSLFLNLLVATLCFVILYQLSGFLHLFKQPAEVVTLAIPFFDVLIFSMIPVSVFFVGKQYCEGLSNTRIALVISITGNVINVILNYVLIYGKLGFPEMGYIGSAWASFIARVFMGVTFLVFIFKSAFGEEIRAAFRVARVNLAELRALWKIGINSAMQFTFEVAAFVIAGLMAGVFGKEQIDAHGIALSIASFTYMFGSGLGSASTIRAGIFYAQNDWSAVRMTVISSLRLILLIMGCFAGVFVLLNNVLPLAFSGEPEIVSQAGKLLIIAAMFQLFDGLQVTAIGLLRGLQDVRVPTLIALVGYWLLALPFAYFLAFNLKLETIGIWIALLTALFVVALLLVLRLRFLLKKNRDLSVQP